MYIEEIVLLIIEIIGVIAFAMSGAIRATLKKMDIVGVLLLAIITAFGGGFIRDLCLGITPPNLFVNTRYFMLEGVALLTALAWFVYAYIKKQRNSFDIASKSKVLNFADAIGLGVFCVTGAQIAINLGYGDNLLLVVFVGCITGVGGGVLRDVLVGEIPIIFRKYVYFIPAFMGTLIYYLLTFTGIEILAITVGIFTIIILRIFAIIYRWNLPSVKISD